MFRDLVSFVGDGSDLVRLVVGLELSVVVVVFWIGRLFGCVWVLMLMDLLLLLLK